MKNALSTYLIDLLDDFQGEHTHIFFIKGISK